MRKQTLEIVAKFTWAYAILAGGLMVFPALYQPMRMWMVLVGLPVFGLGFGVGVYILFTAFSRGMERAFRHALAGALMNGAILSFLVIVICSAPPGWFPWPMQILLLVSP